MQYERRSLKELRMIGQARGIEGSSTISKRDLIKALYVDDQPQLKNIFKFIPEENKYVEETVWEVKSSPVPERKRVFSQLGVLHTSEEISPSIARSYNLEQSEVVNDHILTEGATLRGQKLGDASGGEDKVVRDKRPENEEL